MFLWHLIISNMFKYLFHSLFPLSTMSRGKRHGNSLPLWRFTIAHSTTSSFGRVSYCHTIPYHTIWAAMAYGRLIASKFSRVKWKASPKPHWHLPICHLDEKKYCIFCVYRRCTLASLHCFRSFSITAACLMDRTPIWCRVTRGFSTTAACFTLRMP